MAQVTDETLRLMREHAERGEVFPLTSNEMMQLAFLAAKGMGVRGTSGQPELFECEDMKVPMPIEFPSDRTFHALSAAIVFDKDTERHAIARVSVAKFSEAFNTYVKGKR